MNRIIEKERLAENIYRYRIENKDVAIAWKPGQFIILRVHDKGERIPLTIVEADKGKGTIDIIFQVAGKTTALLSELDKGESILDLAGPLGNPSHIEKIGRCLVVAGGVGVAVAYPVLKALKDQGNEITSIIGAKEKSLLILTEEIKDLSSRVIITTDDGSSHRKGFTTDILSELLSEDDNFDYVYTVGPVVMMQRVSEITKKYKIKTVASLNTIMVDATGMCGGCRTQIAGEEKFACVHGPEFDAHQVNFDLLKQRTEMFKEKECQALKHYEKTRKKQ
jgi:NAD(P)H-flavin reductase